MVVEPDDRPAPGRTEVDDPPAESDSGRRPHADDHEDRDKTDDTGEVPELGAEDDLHPGSTGPLEEG